MKVRFVIVVGVILLLTVLVTSVGSAANGDNLYPNPIPLEGTQFLKDLEVPTNVLKDQSTAAASLVEASQCTPADEGSMDIITVDFESGGAELTTFWRETVDPAPGKATLWVAWDDLKFGTEDDPRNPRTDITCDQLEYLQGVMDSIVDTDIHYFGEYVQRPAGNENIDVMIYNVKDEFYYDTDAGSYIAGFFWGSLNEANNRNMIFIDNWDWANRLGADAAIPYVYEGTVAHELEHLIHYDHDADEPSWVDEGLADLAEYLNDFGHPDGHVVYALAFHRNSLTTWGSMLEDYGTSYLFQLYLLEQFGTKTGGVWDNTWTRMYVDEPANGIEGVENATGANFDDLYDAWIMANYVDDPNLDGAGGFPIGYEEIDLAPYNSPRYGPWSIEKAVKDIYGSDAHGNLPISRYWGGYVSGTVEYPVGAVTPYTPIYSTYKGIQPRMNIYLRGQHESGVAAPEGDYEVASGGGNLISRMLELNVPVGGTLTFQTYFDIEEDWDYGFVEVSTDNGTTWEPLAGNITKTNTNPNLSTAWDNSLVSGMASTDAAITGSTQNWVNASFDLPADNDVLVRFSYYTDEAVNGLGWFIDDVAVTTPAGFADGFEAGAGNWTLGGWEWTTGLFENDWVVGYVNPVYARSRFSYLDFGYLQGDDIARGNEYVEGTVDTSHLTSDQAAVVFANRSGESPFAADYLILVDKGNASGH